MEPGDEPLGLAAALLGVGVRSVLAAAGPVDDELAASVMTTYHERLVAGESSAQSLRTARTKHPGAAIFTVYGADWSARAATDGRVPDLRRGRGTP